GQTRASSQQETRKHPAMTVDDLVLFTTVIGVVMLVMVLLALFIYALARLAAGLDKPVATAADVTDDELGDELSPEIVAVLAAAASEILGGRTQIRSVRLHREADAPEWSTAGRMDIMLSHRVGPRR
ncbi:MAG TPA: OadG family protein, partial [Polyangiaceae bacterium]|nr:OadG family protein [Polyangiaceae bacterium]